MDHLSGPFLCFKQKNNFVAYATLLILKKNIMLIYITYKEEKI